MKKLSKTFSGLLTASLLLIIPVACSLQQASGGNDSGRTNSQSADALFAAAATVTIEAESMSKSGYSNESNANASGGQVIKLSSTTGSVTKSFSGVTAAYDISVKYIDQISGAAAFTLFIAGTTIATWSGDQATTADLFVTKTFSNITVANGAQIKLTGTKNGSEAAKYDLLIFTPVGAASSTSSTSSSSSTTTSSSSTTTSSSSSTTTSSSKSSSSSSSTTTSSSSSKSSSSSSSVVSSSSSSNSSPISGTIYLSPIAGVDNSIQLGDAMRNALPGTTIYLNAGTYPCSTTITLDPAAGAHGGTASAPIKIIANGKVDIDFSGQAANYGTDGNAKKNYRGIVIRPYMDYLYFKGLDVHHAGDNGVKCEGSHITFELCSFRQNGDSGLQIGLNKDTITVNPDPQNVAAYNKVINCDAYLNYDTQTSGSNSDGFSCKMYCGEGNYYYGCRAWQNADDGWDLYMANATVTIENCWAFESGKDSGNGNGFKLGSATSTPDTIGVRIVKNCIAVSNKKKGFDQNNSTRQMILYNNSGWNNGEKDYYFKNASDATASIFTNNLIIPTGDDVYPSALGTNNSWNLTTVTVTAADFASVDLAAAEGPRQADGSLPASFGRLVSGSDCIDKGVNVGLPYNGSSPDLGAYEY